MRTYKQYTMPMLCLIVVLLMWEVLVQVLSISSYVLPAPSDIAAALMADFEELLRHSMVTLQEAVSGLLIASLLAVLIAILMDLSGTFRRCVFPYLVISQTVPVMVLGPLFSIWLGFGMGPKVLMVIFMCFFPMAIALSDALQQTDPKQLNLLRSFGASKLQVYLLVKLPGAAAALFSGLKVSATYCIGGAIVGEWLSASAGLGYYMIRVKNGFMMDKVFACVVMIAFWSLLLNFVVKLLEWIIFPYTKKRKGAK